MFRQLSYRIPRWDLTEQENPPLLALATPGFQASRLSIRLYLHYPLLQRPPEHQMRDITPLFMIDDQLSALAT